MATYQIHPMDSSLATKSNEVFLVASGDLRLSANQICWPAQEEMERKIAATFSTEGITVRRAHPINELLKHGFIWNQRMGMATFSNRSQGSAVCSIE